VAPRDIFPPSNGRDSSIWPQPFKVPPISGSPLYPGANQFKPSQKFPKFGSNGNWKKSPPSDGPVLNSPLGNVKDRD